ncbi:hypothetical protein NS228_08140 [Methylobacterium indicum]|nr:hypothetical protein QR78_15705 [Methylobacterium indicum]KTS40997.1 hypothetical protein NS228_08140 [Methylobacterium indicum]
MDDDDWRFSMRFACSVAEAVGIDPWDDGSAVILPAPAPLPTIQYVPVPAPPRRPRKAAPYAGQLALDLAA